MSTLAAPSKFKAHQFINLGGKLMSLSAPKVMGILNITPDSFYDGELSNSPEEIEKRIARMIEEGVDIIDVGAASSKPGAEMVSEEEEWSRLYPVLNLLKDKFSYMPVSVDTYRSEIVKRCHQLIGSFLVNDISAGDFDTAMFETVVILKLPYMMMHMQGTPQTMQANPEYDDVVVDICKYFADRIGKLRALGAIDLIVDPGFGFGKNMEHNFQLLARLEEFKILGLPVAVGISRKSMIYKTLETTPDKALTGTIALNALALTNGASILRVHDVQEAVETVKLLKLVNEQKSLQ